MLKAELGLPQLDGVVYGAAMTPRSENRQHTALLTPGEIDLLTEEARRRGVSISAVIEAAILELLDAVDLSRDGLRIPSALGQDTTSRGYQFAPATIARMDEVKAYHRFAFKDVMRAAIFRLQRRLPADR